MPTNGLIIHKQFEVDTKSPNYSDLVEENKKAHEEEAVRELDANMAHSLADYQTRPSWTAEDGKDPNTHIYKLTMRIVFKP